MGIAPRRDGKDLLHVVARRSQLQVHAGIHLAQLHAVVGVDGEAVTRDVLARNMADFGFVGAKTGGR